MIRFSCRDCGTKFSVTSDKGGKSSKCPKCGAVVKIPESPLAVLPAPDVPSRHKLPAIPVEVDAPRRPVRDHADRPVHSTFHTGRSGGFGMMMGMAAILLLVCGGGAVVLMKGCSQVVDEGVKAVEKHKADEQKPAKTDPVKDAKPEPEPARAVAMRQMLTLDELTCAITEVKIGKVPFELDLESDEDRLLVRFKLSTNNDKRKFDHRSWSSGGPRVVATDELGNNYRVLDYSVWGIKGINLSPSITSDSPAEDLIGIEKPVPGATEIRLTLLADETKVKGKFHFVIPKRLWTTP